MIAADYHIHTNFSSDSKASMESMIEKAIQLGLNRICITDHMDYDFPSKDTPFVFDPTSYFTKLEEMKNKYNDKIQVLCGIELGLRPYLSKQYERLTNAYPFDFIIGSSHLVGEMDPYFPEYWEGRSESEGLKEYFQTIIDNIAAFNNFDVYGHLDYVVRYAPEKNKNYSYEAYQEILDSVLKTILDSKKGIEVNTAGYKYGLGFAHPQTDIIKRYLDLGGKILTIGSDGHSPEHIAYDFDRAKELLLSLGATHYTVFEKRKPIFLPLES